VSRASIPTDKYWPTEKDPEELVRNCVGKKNSFQQLYENCGAAGAALKNWTLYNTIDRDGHSGGIWYDARNSMARYFENHLRANARIILQYTTRQSPTWDCQCPNDSPDALEANAVGNRLIDYYWETERAKAVADQVAEYAIIMRSAYALVEWDETSGDPRSRPTPRARRRNA
jgi:hypothetical protein